MLIKDTDSISNLNGLITSLNTGFDNNSKIYRDTIEVLQQTIIKFPSNEADLKAALDKTVTKNNKLKDPVNDKNLLSVNKEKGYLKLLRLKKG